MTQFQAIAELARIALRTLVHRTALANSAIVADSALVLVSARLEPCRPRPARDRDALGGNGLNGQDPQITGSKVSSTSSFASGLAEPRLELGPIVAPHEPVFAMAIDAFQRLGSMGRSLLILTLGLRIVFLEGQVSLAHPLIRPLVWIAAGAILGGLRRNSTAAQALELQANNSTDDSRARLSVPPG
jgi:hypothetical protein